MWPSGTLRSVHGMARRSQRPEQDHTRAARLRRDDALSRIATINRSIVVAALVMTGVLGLYLSKALPGHHAATQSQATQDQSAQSQSTGSSGSSQLAPPASAPVQTQQPAPVVSGAS